MSRSIFITTLACVFVTLLATPLQGLLDKANIVMLFLLTVLLVAVKLGRVPAIFASMLSVLLFDVFFVPPRFSLAVSDLQYLVTFAVMLVTGLITAHLASGLKQRAQEALQREQQTQALYRFAGQLAGALTLQQVDELSRVFINEQTGVGSVLLLPAAGQESSLEPVSTTAEFAVEPRLTGQVLRTGQRIHSDQVGRLGYASLYLPLSAPIRVRGVLAIGSDSAEGKEVPVNHGLLDAIAALIAVAVERLHYVQVARNSEISLLGERLRSSILSALSHDLRTPLTALMGLSDSLQLIKPPLPPVALETAQTVHAQAKRLSDVVGNLLDMARLNAGDVHLRKEWQPLEEVIGSSIKLLDSALREHPVRVSLPADLPLLSFDAVLMERVFCNLLENAAKYSAGGRAIEISAHADSEVVVVEVADRGQGLPVTLPREALFEMFQRGETETGIPGVGLGLAICKAIVQAHAGTICAADRDGEGSVFRFTLPIGQPPAIEGED
ncbi:MAG TPA: DUF4118 domain-containing protein [Accumulibacter sp.]|nr:DUF4118 domain-containing protein [Accumulibacter sp.]HMW19058.1 DUF4118 domain-containing protein [Accumulibacter sp.]HMX23065.1 DUF4118 domain-containing protein [Accumulibacter sp.]HMY06583.1 DUF4118 domain-containing protein [Accumulibacter sp.]HNC19048.1 DUF4118 domain-containing protein [Accumulibacter sp.]